jgi:hypothetical protein
VPAPGRAGGVPRLAAGRRPRACCAAGGRGLPGPHHPARRGAPPLRSGQVPRQQGLGRAAAVAAPTGPLRHLTPSECAPVTGGSGPRACRRGPPGRSTSGGAGRRPRISPSRSTVAVALRAEPARGRPPRQRHLRGVSVPHAVSSLRNSKSMVGAACGLHRPLLSFSSGALAGWCCYQTSTRRSRFSLVIDVP